MSIVTDDEKHLRIFENFQKLKRKKKKTEEGKQAEGGSYDDWGGDSESNTVSGGSWKIVNSSIRILSAHRRKQIKEFLRKKFWKPNVFFNAVKQILKPITSVDFDEKKIDQLIEAGKRSHQTSLVETLKKFKSNCKRQKKILENEFCLWLNEEDLIKASKNCPRQLRLDWVKNFHRLMPVEIHKLIDKCEHGEIFDNYVVLHYDTTGKSSKLTQEESRKKRDPILFGVIADCKILFYIGDWIDEYCDLTLDKLLKYMDKNAEDILMTGPNFLSDYLEQHFVDETSAPEDSE